MTEIPGFTDGGGWRFPLKPTAAERNAAALDAEAGLIEGRRSFHLNLKDFLPEVLDETFWIVHGLARQLEVPDFHVTIEPDDSRLVVFGNQPNLWQLFDLLGAGAPDKVEQLLEHAPTCELNRDALSNVFDNIASVERAL